MEKKIKCYVYLLSHTIIPGTKVGISNDVNKRMKELDSRNSAGSFIFIFKCEFDNHQQAYNVEQRLLADFSPDLLQNSREMISNKINLELLKRYIYSFKSDYKKGETPEKKSKERWIEDYDKGIWDLNSMPKNRNDDEFKNNIKIFRENGCPIKFIPSESS